MYAALPKDKDDNSPSKTRTRLYKISANCRFMRTFAYVKRDHRHLTICQLPVDANTGPDRLFWNKRKRYYYGLTTVQ